MMRMAGAKSIICLVIDPLPRCALPDDGLIVHFGPSASRMRQCRGDARARHFDTVRSISGTRFRNRFRPRGPTYNLHKFIECRKSNWCFFRPERDSTATSLPRTQNGKDEMPPFTDVTYVYDPKALKIMGACVTACRVWAARSCGGSAPSSSIFREEKSRLP